MADNGYFVSSDGGASFQRLALGISNNVKDIDASPELPSRLYAVGPKAYQWMSNQVFVSVDRGGSWVRSPMTGLPEMDECRCNTIAVHPRQPYTVFLAVSGSVAPGGGGPYRSTDGGKTWKWMGHGLPAADEFYSTAIFETGRELAVGPDGTLITMHHGRRQLFRFDPRSGEWVPVRLDLHGAPHTVLADRLQPGRFLAAVQDDGLYLTDDDGVTWKRVYEGNVRRTVADRAVSGRYAAVTPDGVVLSTDGGKTWTALDRSLPQRDRANTPVFAGQRLIIGTHGSGVFWMPLQPAGESPVAARPAATAWVPPVDDKVPPWKNLDMSAGAAAPDHWAIRGKSSGTLRVLRDTDNLLREGRIGFPSPACGRGVRGEGGVQPAMAGNLPSPPAPLPQAGEGSPATASQFRQGPASLRVESVDGPASGNVGQTVDAAGRSFAVSGWGRSQGPKLEKAVVMVEAFGDKGRQITFLSLANLGQAAAWTPFKKLVQMPAGTVRVGLGILFQGEGRVWLDGLKVEPAGKIFLDEPTADDPRHPPPAAAPAPPLPPLVNPDMSAGGDVPDGWKLTWSASGKLRLWRDTTDFQKGPASLCLESVGGPAYGTASQMLPKELRLSARRLCQIAGRRPEAGHHCRAGLRRPRQAGLLQDACRSEQGAEVEGVHQQVHPSAQGGPERVAMRDPSGRREDLAGRAIVIARRR